MIIPYFASRDEEDTEVRTEAMRMKEHMRNAGARFGVACRMVLTVYICLTLILSVCVSCVGQAAAEEEELKVVAYRWMDDLNYETLEDGTVRVANCQKDAVEVVIPDQIDGNPVTTITKDAFSSCKNLKRVVLPDSLTFIESNPFARNSIEVMISWDHPAFALRGGALIHKETQTLIAWTDYVSDTAIIEDGIRSIGEKAFQGSTSLKKIVLPDSVESAGVCAFDGCYNLESIVLSKNLKSIGNVAFQTCGNLKHIDLPESLESIGTLGTFVACVGLESIVLPDHLTSIGSMLFADCTNLKSVTLPSNLTSIEKFGFSNCTSLESIDLPERLTKIGYEAFSGCSALKSIRLPASLTDIDEKAFEGCTSLKEIEIPEGITNLGYAVFGGCSALESVTLPASIQSVDQDAFEGCTSLKTIRGCNGTAAALAQKLNVSYADLSGKVYETGEKLIADLIYEENEEGGISITGYMGKDNVFLILPEEIHGKPVTMIKTEAFESAPITGVIIPGSVKTIEHYAFWNCDQLEEAVLGSGVERLGQMAFGHCDTLEKLNLPATLKTLGTIGANPSLHEIVNDGLMWIKATDGLLISNLDTVIGVMGEPEEVTIPDSISVIWNVAFYGQKKLKSIVIPEGVREIRASIRSRSTSTS